MLGFFKKSGNMLVNYSRLGVPQSSLFPSDDDLPGVDGVNDLSLGEWHEIQMHVKVSDPGQSNGVLEYWLDGIKRFGVYNIENNNGNTVGVSHVELQHVYETFDQSGNKTGPTRDMPTWMKNIVISDTFIPSDCPRCPKPPSAITGSSAPK